MDEANAHIARDARTKENLYTNVSHKDKKLMAENHAPAIPANAKFNQRKAVSIQNKHAAANGSGKSKASSI